MSPIAVILSSHARGALEVEETALFCCHPERSEGPHGALGDGSPRQSWGPSAFGLRMTVIAPISLAPL
jgi:hypothetical protein